METTAPPPIGLKKARKSHLKTEHAVKVEPPDFELPNDGENDPKFLICYGDENFKPVTAPCSRRVWQYAEGESGEGVVRTGLDSLDGRCDFILYREKAERESPVVAIDVLPKQFYAGKGNAPMNNQENNGVTFTVNPATGELRLDPKDIPVGFTRRQAHMMVREINKVDTLHAGQQLGGVYWVTAVEGNRVTLSIPPKNSGRPPGVVRTYGQ